jgi:hypothetical protein
MAVTGAVAKQPPSPWQRRLGMLQCCPRVAGQVSGVVSRIRARGAARQLACRVQVGDRDLHAGTFGIPVAAQHAEPSRLRRGASCGRRAREISARAAARGGSPGGAGRGRRAACGKHLGRARLRSAGWSKSGRSCMVAATRTGRVRLSRRPLSRGSAAPSGLPLKSRDRRRRMPVARGTCSKLQPHARNQAALRLMFGLFAEPSSPHARDRQREQPTWRHGQVRVGLWPFSATVDLGKD